MGVCVGGWVCVCACVCACSYMCRWVGEYACVSGLVYGEGKVDQCVVCAVCR